jgi:hypothetical protein
MLTTPEKHTTDNTAAVLPFIVAVNNTAANKDTVYPITATVETKKA